MVEEQECQTVNQQVCEAVEDTVCNMVDEEVCQVVEQQQCNTVNEQVNIHPIYIFQQYFPRNVKPPTTLSAAR
jgi:hypothetical protein